MEIQKMIKDVMVDHRNKVELFQWAVMNGVASLIYAEYISNMKQKQYPSPHLLVPPIKMVSGLFEREGKLVTYLSDELIDDMVDYYSSLDFFNWTTTPELVLFTGDYIEILKTILDLYIIPNLSRRIPEVIAKKFQIGDLSTKASVLENSESSLFPDGIGKFVFYLYQEISYQLITLLPTVKRNMITPEDVKNIQLTENDALIIENNNAICPVIFSPDIFRDYAMDLMGFTTSTSVMIIDPGNEVQELSDDDKCIRYIASTSPFNTVSICRFI